MQYNFCVKKLCCIFLCLLFSLSAFARQRLEWKSASFPNSITSPNEISEDFFDNPENLVIYNFDEDFLVWSEGEFTLDERDNTVFITFNESHIKEVRAYCYTENGEWRYLGKTGNLVPISKRNVPGLTYAIGMSPRNLREHNRIRLMVKTFYPKPYTAYVLTRSELQEINDARLIKYSLFLGVAILAICLFVFFSFLFKNPLLQCTALLSFVNVLFLLFETNMNSYFRWIENVHNSDFYNLNVTLFFISSVTWFIKENVEFQFIKSSKKGNRLNAFGGLFIVTVCLLILLLPFSYGMYYIFQIFALAVLILVSLLHIQRMFTHPENKIYSLVHTVVFMLYLAKLLLSVLRMTYPENSLISFLEYDDYNTYLFFILFLTIDSVVYLGKVYTSKAQKKTKNIRKLVGFTEDSKALRLVVKKLSDNINQGLLIVKDDIKERETEGSLYYKTGKSFDYIAVQNDIINFLSTKESGIETEYEDVIYLLPFVQEMLEFNELMLAQKQCRQIKQVKIDGKICVKTNRLLLESLLRLMMITADNHSLSKSEEFLKASFVNGCFTFSCTFDCIPPNENELQILLSMKKSSREEEDLINSWGPNIFLMNYLTKEMGGSFSILPAKNGITFSIQVLLQSSLFYPRLFKDNNEQYLPEPYQINYEGFDQTVLIADSNLGFRISLADRFHKSFNVIAVSNGQEAYEKLFEYTVNAIVISENLSVLDVKQFMQSLRKNQEFSNIPVYVFVNYKDAETALYYKKLGAIDVVDDPLSSDNFLLTVKNTLDIIYAKSAEKIIDSPSVTVKKTTKKNEVEGLTNAQNDEFDRAGLTKKEKQIALYISKGMSDKEISDITGISAATVAVHNRNIFKKLGIHKRSELQR